MTRDQKIIHQMLSAFDNGEIDWSKVPALKQSIDEEVQRQLVARSKELDMQFKKAIQKSLDQSIKNEHEQVTKKYQELAKQVDRQERLIEDLDEIIDSADKNASVLPWVIGIGVIMLIGTTILLAWLVAPMIFQRTGMHFIWSFMSPNWSFWGILRGLGGVIGIFLLIVGELMIVAFPTTVSIKLLTYFIKKNSDSIY